MNKLLTVTEIAQQLGYSLRDEMQALELEAHMLEMLVPKTSEAKQLLEQTPRVYPVDDTCVLDTINQFFTANKGSFRPYSPTLPKPELTPSTVARYYINRSKDRSKAEWQVFKAIYQGRLTLDRNGTLYLDGCQVSLQALQADFETTLGQNSVMRWNTFVKRLIAWSVKFPVTSYR